MISVTVTCIPPGATRRTTTEFRVSDAAHDPSQPDQFLFAAMSRFLSALIVTGAVKFATPSANVQAEFSSDGSLHVSFDASSFLPALAPTPQEPPHDESREQ